MVERLLKSPQETEQLAILVADQLRAKSVVLLKGPMGAGKTYFVRSLCRQLGVPLGDLASPTYALHHSYQGNSEVQLEHWDLYRLEDEGQLESSGFWDQFSDEQRLVLVEWADRIPGHWWPLDWTLIEVELAIEGSGRRVRVSGLFDPNSGS